jgi:ABC-type protease/lipase transport system fused ATPase/permease subunit
LQGLNAEFKEGQVIAIAGHSGAGKSTLLRCILGISQGVMGQARLNGQDMTQMQREVLGAQVGYMPQDIELMDGTIADNIARFGEVNSEAVIEAAQKVGIHQMILRMPKGYDTSIGEAGGFLSGGQRQRLALARAIYGNPQLLVLDEPTSALDVTIQKQILDVLQQLQRDKGLSYLLITHDVDVIRAMAHHVLVMKAGDVVEAGEADQVMDHPQHLYTQTLVAAAA